MRICYPRSCLLAWMVGGCTFGGGPTAGLRLDGKRAGYPVLGAEVEAGVGFVQLIGGFAGGFGFGRVDLSLDPIVVGSNNETQGVAARVGLGGGGDADGAGFTFAAGLGAERAFGDVSQCSETHVFGVITLDLRYARGWQLVLAPRIAGFRDVCSH